MLDPEGTIGSQSPAGVTASSMMPQDIERLFQSRATPRVSTSGSSADEDDDIISDAEREFRTEKLRHVLAVAQSAWATGLVELDLIAEKLADGSRDPTWRTPIGDSGLLDFFLGILPVDGLRQSLLIHALRLIGNSSADTDENREGVVQSHQIPSIIRLLSEDSLLQFIIPVLYNVCVDYEPAQLEACNASLSRVLVDIISGPRLHVCRPLLDTICKILKLLISQDPEASVANPATPTHLLALAVSRTNPPDLQDYCSLTTVALAYLTHEQFQVHLLEAGHLELLMQCFDDSYARFATAESDPGLVEELTAIRSAFVPIFAEISAAASFSSLPLDSPPVRRLISWLGSSPLSHPNLQTAACLSLGNLARSDLSAKALLTAVLPSITSLLTSVTSPPASGQLLHAFMSFLKNLAIPLANKPILGGLLLEPSDSPILARLWDLDTQPQTQFAAISLTRLLLTSCAANVSRICTPLSTDPSSPDHERTNLHLVLSISDRTDAEPTKFEARRAVAAVCKVLHSPPETTSSSPIPFPLAPWGTPPTRFYTSHSAAISTSLGALLTQHRFPALRSEALLALALMSRDPAAAHLVIHATSPPEVQGALAQLITGSAAADPREVADPSSPSETGPAVAAPVDNTPGPGMDTVLDLGLEPTRAGGLGGGGSSADAQASGVNRLDRENGLVLVAELLKLDGSVLPQSRRSVLEDLLRAGGEMVANERRAGGSAV